MIELTIEIEIGRPVAEVFAYVADPGLLATWQAGTVSAVAQPPGSLRLGTRVREVHRAPGGRELASLVEVCELEPDRVLALRVLEGLPIHARITFAPAGAGTRLRFTAHGGPTGVLRLAQPVLRLVLRRRLSSDCARLKRVLEGGGAAG